MRDSHPSQKNSTFEKELKRRSEAGGCTETWAAAQELRTQNDTTSTRAVTRRSMLSSLVGAGTGISTVKAQTQSLAGIIYEQIEGRLSTQSHQYITIEASESDSVENYSFSVSGENIKKSTECDASINTHDTINDSTVEGKIYTGRDSYEFTGSITQFSAGDEVSVYINCVEVLPESVGNNIITLGYPGGDGQKSYQFSVSRDLTKSRAFCASINSQDDISNRTATGVLYGGRDSYQYWGGVHTNIKIPDGVTRKFTTKESAPTPSDTEESLPDPGDVQADRVGYSQSILFDNSELTQPLVRVYQADGADLSRLEDVAGDISEMLRDCEPIDGHRIEWYETNITGLRNCIRSAKNGKNCYPYKTIREYIGPGGLEHHTRGGGNIFIHQCGRGGTLGGSDYGNYITMSDYNNDYQAPVSTGTLDKEYSKNGEIYWAAAHEIGHQLLGSRSWWGAPGESEDFGTQNCCNPNNEARCTHSHYLSTVQSDKSVTVMSAPNRGSDGDKHWRCGDCSNQEYDAEYASVRTSSCFDKATQDAIRYIKVRNQELPPVGEFENPPTDPDDDGLYEDINGDDTFDIVDVQALFANLDDDTVQNNPDAFDFNGDGQVDVVDVQALFDELESQN